MFWTGCLADLRVVAHFAITKHEFDMIYLNKIKSFFTLGV